MATLPKAIYAFATIPIKMLTQFFTELGRTIHVETQKTQRVKTSILTNKRTAEGIAIPDVKFYCRPTIRQTAFNWPGKGLSFGRRCLQCQMGEAVVKSIQLVFYALQFVRGRRLPTPMQQKTVEDPSSDPQTLTAVWSLSASSASGGGQTGWLSE